MEIEFVEIELAEIMPHAEVLIFAAERPLTVLEITTYLSAALEQRVAEEKVAICLEAIAEKYSAAAFPFSLKQSGGGYQFLTKAAYHHTVQQLNGDKYMRKLSTAALETLSIIAYKQPITKSEIEWIRGVSVDYAIQKLLEKELIIIMGRKEDSVGKPLIYATSKGFMDYLGINAASELPQLKDIDVSTVVMPTLSAEAVTQDVHALETN